MLIDYDKVIENIGREPDPVIGFSINVLKCKDLSILEFVSAWIDPRHFDFLKSCGLEAKTSNYFDARSQYCLVSVVKFLVPEVQK